MSTEQEILQKQLDETTAEMKNLQSLANPDNNYKISNLQTRMSQLRGRINALQKGGRTNTRRRKKNRTTQKNKKRKQKEKTKRQRKL